MYFPAGGLLKKPCEWMTRPGEKVGGAERKLLRAESWAVTYILGLRGQISDNKLRIIYYL